jgi:hypothetical protein
MLFSDEVVHALVTQHKYTATLLAHLLNDLQATLNNSFNISHKENTALGNCRTMFNTFKEEFLDKFRAHTASTAHVVLPDHITDSSVTEGIATSSVTTDRTNWSKPDNPKDCTEHRAMLHQAIGQFRI